MANKSKKSLKKIKTKSLSRNLSVAVTSLRAGLSLASHSVKQAFKNPEQAQLASKEFLIEQAKLLTKELSELKGTMMKVGQMLSIAGDQILPPEVTNVLKSLQADSLPLTWESIYPTLKRSLGEERLATLEINKEPLAAASIGQVHRARCKRKGEQLCLKIQYPGVAASIDSDLKTLKRLLVITRLMADAEKFNEIQKELRYMFLRETDYLLEAEQTKMYAQLVAGDDRFIVPKIRDDLTTKQVLATSYEEGIKSDSAEIKSWSQERRNYLATASLELFFTEFFKWGVVQTDPNPGNYLIRPGKSGTPDQIVLLDFGAVRKFPQTFLQKYYAFIWAVHSGDRERMNKASKALGLITGDEAPTLLDALNDLSEMITEPFRGDEPYSFGNSDLLARTKGQAMKIALTGTIIVPPREVTFLHRKLAGIHANLVALGAIIPTKQILDKYK